MLTFANREVCDLIIQDYATKKTLMSIEYANTTSQELTGETVKAYGGKAHSPRVPFYGEKAGVFTISTQLMTSELFKLVTGAVAKESLEFLKRIVLTPTEGKLTIPAGTTFIANSIEVFAADDDCGTPIVVTTTGNEITLPSGGETAESYVVYGLETIQGDGLMTITSKSFPKSCIIYANTLVRGEDEVDYPYVMKAYKAAPQQNFTFGFSNTGDPTTFEIKFDLLADKDGNILDQGLIKA